MKGPNNGGQRTEHAEDIVCGCPEHGGAREFGQPKTGKPNDGRGHEYSDLEPIDALNWGKVIERGNSPHLANRWDTKIPATIEVDRHINGID